MDKSKVVVLRDNEKFEVTYVESDAKFLDATTTAASGAKGYLSVPIEKIIIDGKEHFFARWSGDINEESVLKAIEKS